MVTWGLLRLPAAPTAATDAPVASGAVGGEGAIAAGLAAHLDGALAVAADATLRSALDVMPADVTRVVEVDASLPDTRGSGSRLAALIAGLSDGHAAVIAARPMADALKRVEGDVVVASLDREGLLGPCLPFVFDRAVLASVLPATGDAKEGTEDAIGLLLAAGHAVRVMPTEGAPFTLRAGSEG
jgi:2-C-methyl-D-erythritol 4-phosphate cytidylyltransferase/2-C-methyl-D-erythritol 2,4-cyclodiphosphate synthase